MRRPFSIILIFFLIFASFSGLFIVKTVKADTVTYYMDDYNTGEVWITNPTYMTDSSETTYSRTTTNGDVHACTDNTYESGGSGTITNVELRCYGYYAGGVNDAYLRPVFSGTTDGSNYASGLPSSAGWTSYDSIYSDAQAPSPWTWSAVEALNVDVEATGLSAFEQCWVGMVQIRVTYTPPNTPPTTTLDAIPDPAESSDVCPFTGNAQDSDGTIADVEIEIYCQDTDEYWDVDASRWARDPVWFSADPSDGTFNSNNEDFEYDIGTDGGEYTDEYTYDIQARAKDDDSDYDGSPATDSFTYDAGGWVNTAPSINPSDNETVDNSSFLFELHPTLTVWVEDTDGNNTVCDIYTSTDGSSYTLRQHYASSGNRTLTYSCTVDNWNDTVYWKVYANDGIDNVSKWFKFTDNGYFPYCALYFNGTDPMCYQHPTYGYGDGATLLTNLPADVAPPPSGSGGNVSTVEWYCGTFTRAQFNDTMILNDTADFKINNMYAHVWVYDDWDLHIIQGWNSYFRYKKTWDAVYIETVGTLNAWYNVCSMSAPSLDATDAWINLSIPDLFECDESLMTYSSVSELYENFTIYQHGVNGAVWYIGNRTQESFIILNVPEDIWDGTDNTTDSDSDGLSDHVELNATWGSATNPFETDTDNDGVDDYEEYITDSTDPNDYTDFVSSPVFDIEISPSSWDGGKPSLGTNIQNNFALWQNGTATIDVKIGVNDTNYTFVTYENWVSNGHDRYCANFTVNNWVSETNIATGYPPTSVLKSDLAPGNMQFGVRMWLPKTVTYLDVREDFLIVLVISEST